MCGLKDISVGNSIFLTIMRTGHESEPRTHVNRYGLMYLEPQCCEKWSQRYHWGLVNVRLTEKKGEHEFQVQGEILPQWRGVIVVGI